MLASLHFAVSFASRLFDAVLMTLLGPFFIYIAGIGDEGIPSLLLATTVALVPRVGTATLSLLTVWLLNGLITGTFTIVNRVTQPTYYRPGKVVAPGPRNPLGTRWIGLSQKGYGIHGTDAPQSIGHARSQGCIRLRNADVEKLFERVRAGDVVELHAERTPEIERFFDIVPAED